MKTMYLGTETLFFVAIVCQTIYGQVQASGDPSSQAQSESGDSLVESVVPDEYESEPEEPHPPSQSNGESGGSQESQSPVEEYLKEHPEVRSVPSGINEEQKTKFAYNKFGDVISVPDKSLVTKPVLKQDKKETQQPPQQPMFYPVGYPGYQMSGYPQPLQPGYPPMYGYPYYYQFGYNQMVGQPQPQQPVIQQPNPIPTKPQKPYGIIKTGKIDPNIPEDVRKHFKQSESDDEQLAAVVQAAEQAKANREYQIQQPQVSQMIGMGPELMLKPSEKEMASNPLTQKRVVQNPYAISYPPQFQPMAYLQPNQFKIDRNNMQIIPMALPEGAVVDPNIMEKLKSGVAKLDMTDAHIIPMPLDEKNTIKRIRSTEAPTIEEYPEIPEVVIKKPHKPKKVKKIVAHLVKSTHVQPKHVSQVLKKPTFILRARLSNLPKKNQKGKNQWWKRPIPKHCFDPIIEITECKDKKLEKRWSYNPEDERCYLYEDYCAKVKKNTFKSINQCMMTCWRPK